jgi:hypothetical protein
MHWFWRVTIALVVAGVLSTAVWYGIAIVVDYQTNRELILTRYALFIALLSCIPAGSALLAYTFVTRRFSEDDPPAETRCRKCGYILRGISEPRCPECGERI